VAAKPALFNLLGQDTEELNREMVIQMVGTASMVMVKQRAWILPP
jgi:hypothetical protein